MADTRTSNLPNTTTLNNGDYVYLEDSSNTSKHILVSDLRSEMQDTTNLNTQTTADSADQLFIRDVSAGETKKITAGNLLDSLADISFDAITDQTALSAAPADADEFVLYDVDGADSKKVTLSEMRDGILNTGKILQVQSTTLKSTVTLTAPTTFTAVSGLTVSITPSSTSNYILLFINIGYGHSSFSGYDAQWRVTEKISAVKDDLIAVGDGSGSRTRMTFGTKFQNTDRVRTEGMHFLYNPATTSTITFGIDGRTDTGNIYVNRHSDDNDVTNTGRSVSTITVMEVQA